MLQAKVARATNDYTNGLCHCNTLWLASDSRTSAAWHHSNLHQGSIQTLTSCSPPRAEPITQHPWVVCLHSTDCDCCDECPLRLEAAVPAAVAQYSRQIAAVAGDVVESETKWLCFDFACREDKAHMQEMINMLRRHEYQALILDTPAVMHYTSTAPNCDLFPGAICGLRCVGLPVPCAGNDCQYIVPVHISVTTTAGSK